MAVRVALADDHLLVREGVHRILDRDAQVVLVAAVADGDSLCTVIEEHAPDVVIADIGVVPSGRDEDMLLADLLHRQYPGTGLLVISQYVDPGYALALFRHGSAGRGYLLKDRICESDDLVAAVRDIAAGGSVIDPMVIEVLVSTRARTEQSPLRLLTPREQEILAELASGRSNAAIARELVITRRSVEHHISSIFAKLRLSEEADISRRVQATLLFLDDQSELENADPRIRERQRPVRPLL
jgi:DNA-binding NarL/FixJ family response regulator